MKGMETNRSHMKHQRGVGNVYSLTRKAYQDVKWSVDKLSGKIDNCDQNVKWGVNKLSARWTIVTRTRSGVLTNCETRSIIVTRT